MAPTSRAAALVRSRLGAPVIIRPHEKAAPQALRFNARFDEMPRIAVREPQDVRQRAAFSVSSRGPVAGEQASRHLTGSWLVP